MGKIKGVFFPRLAGWLDEPKIALKIIAITSLCLNILIEILSRKSLISLFRYIFLSPHLFIYNTLIIAALFSVLFIFKRRVFGYFTVLILWLIIGVTNFILLLSRTTPFTAQDLRLIQYAVRIVDKFIPVPFLILLGAVLLCVIFGIVWLFYAAKQSEKKIRRVVMFGISFFSACFLVLVSKIFVLAGFIEGRFTNIGNAYKAYGVPYCFCETLLRTGISKPSDYSGSRIDEIIDNLDKTQPEETKPQTKVPEDTTSVDPSLDVTETQVDETLSQTDPAEDDDTTNQTVSSNIIVIQLESFFDVTTLKNVVFNTDPLSYYHSLMREYSSGYVSVPSIGAGTANTEFEVLTTISMDFFGPGEYPYKTILNKKTCESIPYVLKKLGYTTHAIHNNDGTFYERNHVFSNLGFDTFTPIEYMYDLTYTETGWAKDEHLIPYIKKALSSTKGRDFVYAISVQGHGAYPQEMVIKDQKIRFFSTNETINKVRNEFTYYVNQLYEMDNMIRKLTQELSKLDEPVTLVLFGDHLPGFSFTEEDIWDRTLFETPYVIWSNFDKPRKEADLETSQLLPYALMDLNICEGILCRLHQNYLSEDKTTISEETYIKNLETIAFDMLYGQQLVFNGVSPYLPTDLKLGLSDITITEVLTKKNLMFILGEGFNEYSVIYIDGKAQETVFVNKNALIAVDYEVRDMQTVFVGQVGIDRILLGVSNEVTYQNNSDEDVEIIHPTKVDDN